MAIMKSNFNEQCITRSQMSLIFNMRIFWRRHAIWSRIYIISRYLGIGTAEESFERLYLENLDFGDMLHIHFNHSIANEFSRMMIQFSIGLRELTNARIAEDFDAVRQNIDRLLQNADQTAKFLASVNPYFEEAELRNLFTIYLEDTLQEADLFASKDFRADIEYFDRLMDMSNTLGDTFAEALYNYITSGAQYTPQEGQMCITYEQMNLIYDILSIRFDIITWVRALMLSKFRDVGNEEAVYARLQKVVADNINNLKQFFGENPGINELEMELYRYIELIDALLTAQKAGNTEEVDQIVRQLYQNANDTAAAYVAIVPSWDQDRIRTMLINTLRSTIDESIMFLEEDFGRNLEIFSLLMDQAEYSGDSFLQDLLNYLFQEQPELPQTSQKLL